jgi:hypothetical protein
MSTRKIPIMLYGVRFLLVLLVLAGSFIFPARHLVYAHTFSSNESAEFLSLVNQIRAETGLVTMNLENSNTTLAQAHSAKALSLLDNDTLGEIRERNNRIADNLETGLEQLKGNVTSLASSASQGQIPQDRIQSVNQAVMSLNDSLAEAVTVRVESEQQNNATTWALALADLVNVVLSDYGNATGASFDLTDMSNMVGMGGMQSNDTNNTTTMMTSDERVQMSGNSSSDANTMTMVANATTSSMSNTTATIVDVTAYQSARYLANNTILRLFNDTLKPLTLSSNETSADNNNNSNNNASATTTQEAQDSSTTPDGNMTSNIGKLEAGLLQLKDDINGKATPNEVMVTAHVNIHPLLMQIYGLVLEQEHGGGEEEHAEDSEGQ